jgi:hypothetical protein
MVPGVQVTITNKATNITHETLTNEVGFYRFVAVEPGDYSVEFQFAGFETKKVETVSVKTAQEVVINQTLQVSSVAASVSVVAEAPGAELEKTMATVERTFSQRVVQDLPSQVYNGGRDITRLALLAPTVNRAPGSNEFAANGQRARNNNFTMSSPRPFRKSRSRPPRIPRNSDEPAARSFPQSPGAVRTVSTATCGNTIAAAGWSRSA